MSNGPNTLAPCDHDECGLTECRQPDRMISPMLTQWELMVLLDGLHGSLRIHDRLNFWRWTADQRKGVLDAIYTRMNQLPVKIANAATEPQHE